MRVSIWSYPLVLLGGFCFSSTSKVNFKSYGLSSRSYCQPKQQLFPPINGFEFHIFVAILENRFRGIKKIVWSRCGNSIINLLAIIKTCTVEMKDEFPKEIKPLELISMLNLYIKHLVNCTEAFT